MKEPHVILRELRVDSDLFQKDIAEYLDISQQQYSSYENAKSGMPADVLVLLADFYKVSTDYIMGRTKSKSSIDALNKQIHNTYSAGELISDVLSLDDAGKAAVIEFIKFQKSKGSISKKDQ